MQWRFTLFLLAIPLAGCDSSKAPPPPPPLPADAAIRAKAVIDQLENSREHARDYWQGGDSARAIAGVLEAAQLSREELLNGCVELLQRGSPEERASSARLLGRLKEPAAITPLTAALADPNDRVRKAACYALHWADAKGGDIKQALVGLRRDDPSVAVRVAAADVLGDSDDEDSTAAYKLGLQSKDSSLWEVCEERLEKRGKLELPLPEHVYTEIPYERYQEYKSGKLDFYGGERLHRETVKDGTIYLETFAGGHHSPVIRMRYRTKAPPSKDKGPE
jgi:hypothetical protein